MSSVFSVEALVIGDSYAAAYEADTGETKGWPVYLNVPKKYRQGINGSTAKQWANNKGGILTKAINTPSEVAIISLMGNDAMNAFDDEVLSAHEIADGIASLRKVVEKFQDRKVYVIHYPNPFCKDYMNGKPAGLVKMLNTAIDVAIIETGAMIMPICANLSYNDFDGKDIHPKLSGHKRMATYARHMLWEHDAFSAPLT